MVARLEGDSSTRMLSAGRVSASVCIRYAIEMRSPGSTRATMQTHLPIERPRSFFTCASGGLGHSLPAGVGMALATGSARKVIGLFGDGSSMYSIQALWSAADLKLPMTIIIVNNGGYAALSEFLSHFNLKEPIGTEVRGIDFVGLAKSLGCAGVRVQKPSELATTLRDAIQSPIPILVDVVLDS